jgi:hypothetical protein
VDTIDGRFLVNADVLTELGEKGLYKEGFGKLPKVRYQEITVMLMEEAKALLPVFEEEEIDVNE